MEENIVGFEMFFANFEVFEYFLCFFSFFFVAMM